MQADPISQIVELTGLLRKMDGIEKKPTKEQVKYLCKLLGFKLQDLAMALILTREAITVQELADVLGVTRGSIYRWETVAWALRAKNAKDYDAAIKAEEI